VEHEREALGRRERLQHDEQGETDGVAEERLLLRVDAALPAHDRVGHVEVEGVLAP
jgi:hypothetical protein